jgi:hypothetical protein
MAAKKKRTGIEWVGGLISMPAYVTGEGKPYRPEALFWMGAEGAVLGHTAGKPGELIGVAAESLRNTIEHPIFGNPHRPDRVRVASPEVADALRAGHPGLDVVCAPTPEIDAVLAAMREKMGKDAETEQSYLSPEIGPEAVGDKVNRDRGQEAVPSCSPPTPPDVRVRIRRFGKLRFSWQAAGLLSGRSRYWAGPCGARRERPSSTSVGSEQQLPRLRVSRDPERAVRGRRLAPASTV